MKTRYFIMVAAATLISVFSCQKDAPLLDEASMNIADDDAVSEAIYEDVFSTADNASIIAEGSGKGEDSKSGTEVYADSCPTITVTRPSGALWPRTITVDFGTGCTGLNDNVRKGKIVIEVTAPRLETGAKRTVTFVDYYFNDIKVEGTKTLETIGFNANQHLVVSVKLTGGKLTMPDGKTIEREVSHQREWIAGLLTKNIWDDECLVTGTVTGVDIKGEEYSNTIMTALHWTRACRFIVSGVVKIERGDAQPVMIDFGTGDCDAKAVVTRGDESKEITLKYRHRMWNN
ncbi:MAG: hypothetical protein IPN68_09460 [Bacteroidetes bacterium]|nr:hypothetical protein [Bacteroidota bacterium]